MPSMPQLAAVLIWLLIVLYCLALVRCAKTADD